MNSATSRTRNVAGKKLTAQSSNDLQSDPSAAVDGDNGTCTITKRERDPYWTVELGGIYTVSGVHINAGECERFAEGRFEIEVSWSI